MSILVPMYRKKPLKGFNTELKHSVHITASREHKNFRLLKHEITIICSCVLFISKKCSSLFVFGITALKASTCVFGNGGKTHLLTHLIIFVCALLYILFSMVFPLNYPQIFLLQCCLDLVLCGGSYFMMIVKLFAYMCNLCRTS